MQYVLRSFNFRLRASVLPISRNKERDIGQPSKFTETLVYGAPVERLSDVVEVVGQSGPGLVPVIANKSKVDYQGSERCRERKQEALRVYSGASVQAVNKPNV